MTLPRVAVSAAGSRSGLAAIRDLGRGGFRVVGATFTPVPFGLRSRWSEPYLHLPSSLEPDALLDILRAGGAEVILPIESSLVAVLSRHRDLFERQQVAVNVPSYDAFTAAYDKHRTVEECQRLGIPAPRLLTPDEAAGTVVVKPRQDIGGARGVAYCTNPDELDRALAACRELSEPVVQEYIPGGADAMRTVVLLFDRDSRLVAHFTTRKIRQYPATGGLMTMGVSTDERALVALVLPFFEERRWRGPAEVELKVDSRDGRAKVIEINPRLPGYLPFAIQCGLHLPRLAALAALGRPAPVAPYDVGRKYVNPGLHLRAVLAECRRTGRRSLALRRALTEWRGARWLDLDDFADPAPRLGKMMAEILQPRAAHRP